MIYYIADLHFKDKRIFDLCNRPYKNVDEYELDIINKWNKKVSTNDTVYILGDIGNEDVASIEIYKLLNGEKHLIVGNHDLKLLDDIKKSNIFKSIKDIDCIKDGNIEVCLCHYPMMDWINYNYGSYHVYGHIHNKTEKQGIEYKEIKEFYKNKNAFNCGVDVTGFEPVTLTELKKLKEEN